MPMLSHLFNLLYFAVIIFEFLFLLHVRFHIHSKSHKIQLQSILDVLHHSNCVYDSTNNVYRMNFHPLYKYQDLLDENDQEVLCVILHLLTQNIPESHHFESLLLKGAHIIVSQDNGLFYQWFKSREDAYSRMSSHKSTVPVYSIPILKNKNSMITGIYPMNNSWFQFEADIWKPWQRPIHSFLHAYNYIYYKVVDSQVGPYGTCSYTDHNPFMTSIDTDEYPTIFSNGTHSMKKNRIDIP